MDFEALETILIWLDRLICKYSGADISSKDRYVSRHQIENYSIDDSRSVNGVLRAYLMKKTEAHGLSGSFDLYTDKISDPVAVRANTDNLNSCRIYFAVAKEDSIKNPIFDFQEIQYGTTVVLIPSAALKCTKDDLKLILITIFGIIMKAVRWADTTEYIKPSNNKSTINDLCGYVLADMFLFSEFEIDNDDINKYLAFYISDTGAKILNDIDDIILKEENYQETFTVPEMIDNFESFVDGSIYWNKILSNKTIFESFNFGDSETFKL